MELTKRKGFLLDWLAKEDSSAYGECHGPDLNWLREQGLAEWPVNETGHAANGSWTRVKLTEAGMALAAKRRAA